MREHLKRHVPGAGVQSSTNVSRSIYGLILTASVITAASQDKGDVAGRIAVYTAVTLLIFWAAHSYSELLGIWIDRRETPTLRHALAVMRSEWALVSAAIPPLLVLLVLGAIPDTSDRPAIDAALWLVLIELTLACGYAAHRGGAKPLGVAAATGVGVLMALLVIAMKVWVH